MIRYRLVCSQNRKRPHEFEAWFSSSEAFDNQASRGQVSCPKCGSSEVAKALMSPQVQTRKGKRSPPRPSVAETTSAAPATPSPPPAEKPVSLASLPPEQREFIAIMRQVREHVVSKSEYVGRKFAEEARKIHYEEAPARGIYGEATLEEAKALAEEGIEALPLPDLPSDNN